MVDLLVEFSQKSDNFSFDFGDFVVIALNSDAAIGEMFGQAVVIAYKVTPLPPCAVSKPPVRR